MKPESSKQYEIQLGSSREIEVESDSNPRKYQEYLPNPEATIKEVAQDMITLAFSRHSPVFSNFDNVPLVALEGESRKSIIDRWTVLSSILIAKQKES